jgi:hypothetical protein
MFTTRFDRTLISPSPDELAGAVCKAADAANREVLASGAPEKARAAVSQDAVARWARRRQPPEGHKRYRGNLRSYQTAHVAVAWWSDAIGRRHVRVRGLVGPGKLPAPVPLAEVYPDRVVMRRTPAGDDLRVVCACGQAGSPAALGWMGEWCGPCHDRRLEGETPHPDVLRGPAGQSARDVAFLPALPDEPTAGPHPASGRVLLASHGNCVRRWDLSDGSCQVLWRTRNRGCHDLLPHLDGRRAVVEERGRSEVSIRDLDTAQRTPLARDCPGFVSMALSPDGNLVLIGGDRARLVDLRTREERFLNHLPPQLRISRRPVAFTRDGRFALVGTDAGTILRADVNDGDLVPLTEAPHDPGTTAAYCEFSADGRRLIYSRWSNLQTFHVWLSEKGTWQTLTRPPEMRPSDCWMALAPDGSAVLFAEHTGRMEFWGLRDPHCLGSLMGPPHGLSSLSFSRDASHLALSFTDGVIRIWPWRRLLMDD